MQKTKLKNLAIFLALFVLSSCVSNLQKLSQKENRLRFESYFSSYLALEYLSFSRSLLENEDYLNAEYFSKKGLDASAGKRIILENPRFWHVNPLELEDLISAQKRYEAVALKKVKELLPIQLAHLTFLYDCWVVQETKPAFRLGELNKCKERFYKLLKEIEDFIANYGRDERKKTEIIEPEFERYFVFFDFDKYKINAKANKQLVEILNAIDALDGAYSILLVGNTDRVAKYLYNENLGLNRAKTVEQYLRKNGVPKNLIEIRVQGEEFPDLVTKDEVQQQFNRTTQVYLIKGATTVRDIPLPVLKNIAYRQEIAREKAKRGWN